MLIKRSKPEITTVNEALPLSECYAKTIQDQNGQTILGMSVTQHSILVGLVAERLMQMFTENLRSNLFPIGTPLVSALHDIGKINPLFQEKLRRGTQDYVRNSCKELKDADPELEKQIGYHSGVSQAALEGVGPYVPEIVGRHHGKSPRFVPRNTDPVIGGIGWQSIRMELIAELKRFFTFDVPKVNNEFQATVIAGLTTVADWIASNSTLLSVSPNQKPDELKKIVEIGTERAGFILPKFRMGLQFSEVFPNLFPRPIQQAFIDEVERPGIYILEALMGEGKTEAALYASYRLLQKGDAKGIYFALPTRLTSEMIQKRVNAFLGMVLDPNDRHTSLLIHANSWLYQSDLGEDGRPGFEWFSSRKRGLLAPFAVGTIDQALMAVMNVKHGFVRTFALAGKVVILDEVHTYDAYTGTILDYLVHNLRQLGCTVILLSATLTSGRKRSLLASQEETCSSFAESSYPMITKQVYGKISEICPDIKRNEKHITLTHSHDQASIIERSKEKALQGEYILWIENTVHEAQMVFKEFAAWGKENCIGVGLLHSRFTHARRTELDEMWVELFGKDALNGRALNGGKILIGTQVLEQSLDLDADFLVTRIAPTDMILQRIGRLWRHQRNTGSRRPDSASPEVVILSPDQEKVINNPKNAFSLTGLIYAPYVLFRSLEVLRRLKQMVIPTDLRTLIENTYIDRNEEGPLAICKQDLQAKKDTLTRYAFISMTTSGPTESDNLCTRYGEVPTCDVLLLKREYTSDDTSIIMEDGTILELPLNQQTSESKKEHIRCLTEHIIRVPVYLAPEPLSQSELSWISSYLYVSSNADERIRVATIKASGFIQGFSGREANKKYILSYSEIYGYTAIKREEVI